MDLIRKNEKIFVYLILSAIIKLNKTLIDIIAAIVIEINLIKKTFKFTDFGFSWSINLLL